MHYNDLIKRINKEDLNNFLYLVKYKYNISDGLIKNVDEILKDVEKSRTYPIQYIVGNVDFYGYNFIVNESVLIPRFETEELVENTIYYIKKYFNDKVSVLDLCTGSGCIGITLKKELPNIEVTLSDISEKALKVAKENIGKLNIKLIKSDILKTINDKYDVIISNPPYISYDEEIMPIVKNNEPNIALYAKNNGLQFYEEILKNCKKNLNEKYLIAFEIGEKQANSIINIANKYLQNIQVIVKKDLQNRDRMIFIMNK